jgi:hypothetical protein
MLSLSLSPSPTTNPMPRNERESDKEEFALPRLHKPSIHASFPFFPRSIFHHINRKAAVSRQACLFVYFVFVQSIKSGSTHVLVHNSWHLGKGNS